MLAAILPLLACVMVVSLSNSAAAAIIASDNASNSAYADGWQAGDNGGTGFGPWSFDFSGSGSGLLHDPQFIDNAPLVENSLGAPAFALTTGAEPLAFETSEVRRTFNLPIAIGQTFSADVDGSALDPLAPPFTIGNTFDFFGANGSERFSLLTNNEFHSGNWTATGDADTGILAGSSFRIEFTLATVNTYNLVLSPIAGGPPLFTQTGATLAGTPGVGINRIRISAYGTGSSIDGSKEMFFDNLTISGPESLLGDYNNDDVVDAADYVAWRKTNGTPAGYNAWRSNFGATINAAGDSVTTVPESTTWPTLLVAFVSTINLRNRRVMYFGSDAAR
ncbi:MAG: hypothetical protein L0228_05310 [Planctomycetes bacterium]|nr:hypothetical protein [Planctomycetota bacterium]